MPSVDPNRLKRLANLTAASAIAGFLALGLVGACDKTGGGGFGVGFDRGVYHSDEREWGGRTWKLPRDPDELRIVIPPAIGGAALSDDR